jgi:hypothetical protein
VQRAAHVHRPTRVSLTYDTSREAELDKHTPVILHPAPLFSIPLQPLLQQSTMTQHWEERARAKREAILAAIPAEWRIDNPRVEDQVDVTGKYIQQFLNVKEIEITETTAVGIVRRIAKGEWKSEEVVRAFCHRAALAHQLVSHGSYNNIGTTVCKERTNLCSSTVFMKCSSAQLSPMRKLWTNTMPNTGSQLVPCTVYQSVSKTSSMSKMWKPPWAIQAGSAPLRARRGLVKRRSSRARW